MTMTSKQYSKIVGASVKEGRSPQDFYETPREATLALLEHVRFDDVAPIWEPACGRGAIVNVLRERNWCVYASDLVYRGMGDGVPTDFLQVNRAPFDCKSIITNPPYNLATEFVQKAIALGIERSAFLLRLQFLEGQRRKRLFEKHPPYQVLVFSKRIPRMHNPEYTGKKTSSMIAFAWFVWERDYEGPTILKWINPVEELTCLPST